MTIPLRARRGQPRDRALATWAHILLSQNELSASQVGKRLGVSVVTAKRIVASLRAQGRVIVSVRRGGRWYYEVREELSKGDLAKDSFVRAAGCVTRWRAQPGGKTEDADYDSD